MSRTAILAALLLLGLASPAMANPVSLGSGFAPPEIAGLLGESVVIAALLGRHRFDCLRVAYTWVAVTYVTYWLMGLFIVGLMTPLSAIGADDWPSFTALILLAEALVVLLEAWIIRKLSMARFYRRPVELLSKKSAVFVSAVGNATSIIIAFAWMEGLW